MKLKRAAFNLCITAHILAWGAFLILMLWPSFYKRTSAMPDDSRGQVVGPTAISIIEARGEWVLIPLLVPVALTALGLIVTGTWDGKRLSNRLLMWGLVVLLVIFSWLSMHYLGTFHLLESLLLLASAIAMSLKNSPTAIPSTNP